MLCALLIMVFGREKKGSKSFNTYLQQAKLDSSKETTHRSEGVSIVFC